MEKVEKFHNVCTKVHAACVTKEIHYKKKFLGYYAPRWLESVKSYLVDLCVAGTEEVGT